MKHYLLFIFLLPCLFVHGQATYNPSYTPLFTVASKPYAISQGAPVDGRSYKADSINFLWRPYNGTTEVLSYLNLAKYRTGQFPIEVNVGGSLNGNGTFTGGYIYEYWFRGGTADTCLVLKSFFPPNLSGFLLAANNLSDVQSASTSRTNLGLGTMATQGTTASSTDLTGTWPSSLVVNSIQGHNLAYLLNYNNLTNKPTIPAQFNPIAGTNMSLSGTYPNITFNAVATVTPTLDQVAHAGNTTDTSLYSTDSISANLLYGNAASLGNNVALSQRFASFYGNSVTVGNASSPISFSMVNQYCTNTNTVPANYGISTTTMVKRSAGDSSFQERMPGIQPYNNNRIFIDYGINDYQFGTTLGNYDTVYARMIDSLHNNKGYPLDSIVLLAPTLIGHISGSVVPSGLELFVNSVDSLAIAKGCPHVDLFHYMVNNGNYNLVSSDSTHPNNFGHIIASQAMVEALGNGALVVRGTSFLKRIVNPWWLTVQAPVSTFNGDLRDSSNTGAVGTITNSFPNPNNVRTVLHNGTATGSYVVDAASDAGTASLVGFETATNMTAAGQYGSPNHGMTLYTEPAGDNVLRTYSGAEDFTQGTTFTMLTNDGTNQFVLDAVNDQLRYSNAPFVSGFTEVHYGKTIFGSGANQDWFYLNHPNTTNANTGNFYPIGIKTTGEVIYTPLIYSSGAIDDTNWSGTLRPIWNRDIVNKIDSFPPNLQTVLTAGNIYKGTSAVPHVVYGEQFTDANLDTMTVGLVGTGSAGLDGFTWITAGDALIYSPGFGISTATNIDIVGGNGSTAIQIGETAANPEIKVTGSRLVQINGTIGAGGATIATTTGTYTIGNGIPELVVNPASTLATLTVTLDGTPLDGQIVSVFAGGTLTSGIIVTTLTVNAAVGEHIVQKTAPTTLVFGDHLQYQYIAATSTWYALQ